MVGFAEWLLRTGWQAAVLAVMVLLAQYLFGRWLSPAWRYRLWGLVVLRLMLPALPASPLSLFNLDPVSAVRLSPENPPQAGAGASGEVAALPPPAADIPRAGGSGPLHGGAGPRVIVTTTPPALLADARGPAPVVPAAGPTDAPPDGLRVFFLVWATGAAVLVLRLAWGHVTFGRRLRRAMPLDDGAAQELLEDCAREAGVLPPRVLITDAVHGPAVCGLLRPTLLLPPGLTWRLEPDELRMVFLHELAHLRCRDVLANWLLEALRVVHWFNPVLWFAFARCRADREMARDAMVLAQMARESHPDPGTAEEPAKRYGQVLLKLLQQAAFAPPRMSQAVGMVGVLDSLSSLDLLPRRGRLTQRIHMIATFTRNARTASRFPLVALLLMLGIGCTTLTGAKDPPAGGKQPPSGDKQPRAGKAPATEAEEAVVTRVYDVRDLLVVVPSFDEVPELGVSRPAPRGADTQPALAQPVPRAESPGPTTRGATPPDDGGRAREQLTRDIIQLVTETVAPDSWRDSGGTTGALRELSGQLIVTQSVRNHRQVLRMLERLREARAIQVQVEATFLSIEPEAWKKLGIEWPKPVQPHPERREARFAFLSDEQAKQLLAAAGAGGGSRIVSSPRMTLFNGQRAYILVATSRAYVSDVTPVKNDQGAIAYEPEISTVESGLVLDAEATVSADRKYVTLMLHPRVSALLGFKERRLPPAAPGAEGAVVQEPQVRLSEVRTVVSVPVGGTLLLGGMEDPDGALLDGRREEAPAGAEGAATRPAATRPAGAKQPRALLLMAKPTVIVQREVRQ